MASSQLSAPAMEQARSTALSPAWSLFLLYALCQGGLLLLPGAYFWDDWAYREAPPHFVFDQMAQLGSVFHMTGWLHVFMQGLGPWSYNVLTFAFFFAAGVALERILRRHAWLSRENRLLIVLLFLVLPLNTARIAHTVFQYTASYLVFFLAWLLLDRHRLVACVLFFASFNTNSLLVFYALPVADLLWRRGAFRSRTELARALLAHLDLLVLPFLFFGIKLAFFAPQGAYESYNAFHGWRPWLPAVAGTAAAGLMFLTEQKVFAALVFLPLVLRSLRQLEIDAVPETGGRRLLALGVAALLLAAFPYWVIGLVPTFHLWGSRHQLLMPLGAAAVLVGVLNLRWSGPFAGRSLKLWVAGMIVSLCIADGLALYGWCFADWMKQKELVRELAVHPEIRTASLIVFDDRTDALNATGRAYRPYEWNGLMLAAFRDGDERRFGVSAEQYGEYLSGAFTKFLPLYRASQHVADATVPPLRVRITAVAQGGPAWLGAWRWFPPHLQIDTLQGPLD